MFKKKKKKMLSVLRDVAFLSSLPSSPRMDTMRLPCLPEPQTVYIDLRDAKPQKSVTFHDENQR